VGSADVTEDKQDQHLSTEVGLDDRQDTLWQLKQY